MQLAITAIILSIFTVGLATITIKTGRAIGSALAYRTNKKRAEDVLNGVVINKSKNKKRSKK